MHDIDRLKPAKSQVRANWSFTTNVFTAVQQHCVNNTSAFGSLRKGVYKATQMNWTELNWTELKRQFRCVARTVQSKGNGSSVHFISAHFAQWRSQEFILGMHSWGSVKILGRRYEASEVIRHTCATQIRLLLLFIIKAFLGRGSEPPSHQLWGLGERCKLPMEVRGRALTANAFWTH